MPTISSARVRRLRQRVLACAALLAGLGSAHANEPAPFDGGVVTLMTPTSAGSSFDAAARALAAPLAKAWGVPVVVDNRPGASTIIASNLAAKAAPDGRTILMVVTPTIQAGYLYPSAGFDPLQSFVPVSQMFDARLWFAVHAKVQADDVAGFLRQAGKAGAEFVYSSPGTGSTPHLNAVQLSRLAGIEMLHVPYRGVSPAVVDLAGGRVQSTFASYSDLLPQVQNGTIRVLASTGPERSPLTPDIPTFAEQGYPGFEFVGFGGFVVPAGTPDALVKRISRDIGEAMKDPDLKTRLINLGLEPVAGGDAAAFGELMARQSAYWKRVIEETGVKPE